MKNKPATRRAFVALVPATLLLAVPGHAQEVQPATPPSPPVQQTVAPPPVVPTIAPPAAAVEPPPVVAPVEAAAPEAEAPAPRAATRTTTTRTEARSTRVVRTPAPVRAAPAPVTAVPVPAPAPADVTPAPVTPPPVEATTPAPVAETAVAQSTTEQQSSAIWPWVLGGLVVLMAAIGFAMMRRRRVYEDAYSEEPYIETGAGEAAPIRTDPAPFAPDPEPQFLRAAPLTAVDEPLVPVAAEDATLVKPEAEEVASLTQADAPVADRPWLEMSLRPVRAGTNVDEALVEIELTVGNAGSIAAEDVRISTFMFASEPVNGSEMERMLIERGEDGVSPVTIKPGEGTRIDATLALSKAALIENSNGSILPIIVADARYTLADGTEGRTSASFTIGVSEDGAPAMSPIKLTERAMHDEVEARLHGVPEHA
ncbi:MAG: hypothetical protein ABIY39_11895 [Sphingomonas sp.]